MNNDLLSLHIFKKFYVFNSRFGNCAYVHEIAAKQISVLRAESKRKSENRNAAVTSAKERQSVEKRGYVDPRTAQVLLSLKRRSRERGVGTILERSRVSCRQTSRGVGCAVSI